MAEALNSKADRAKQPSRSGCLPDQDGRAKSLLLLEREPDSLDSLEELLAKLAPVQRTARLEQTTRRRVAERAFALAVVEAGGQEPPPLVELLGFMPVLLLGSCFMILIGNPGHAFIYFQF